VLLIGAVAGLAIAELSLRLLRVAFPRVSQPDWDRGTAYRPGARWWQTGEGRAHIQINSDGFRDREHSVEKPANTLRVAVLGDSYVAALQVDTSARVTEMLEAELNRAGSIGPHTVEVLNFGQAGYGTVQELMTLRSRVWKYSPDIIVLAFLTGNDLRNNSRRLQKDPGRPYFLLQDGALVFDDSFQTSPDFVKSWWERAGHFAIDYSRLCQLAYHVRNTLKERRTERSRKPQRAGVEGELGLDNAVYLPPQDDVWIEAWALTEGLLDLMNRDVQEHGAAFLVVTLSNGIQVHPDPKVRTAFMKASGVETLFYPDQRVREFGQRAGFPVLNLAPEFQAYAEQHSTHLHGFSNSKMGFGHWNEQGHRLAGEQIAREICRLWELAGNRLWNTTNPVTFDRELSEHTPRRAAE
jgi:hypothetical protein